MFSINRFVITALFGILVYAVLNKEFECYGWIGFVLKKLDEYSFSIYLGHTTVMFIMSQIQEKIGFGDVKLSIFDLIGCVIFIPILHEFIEKPAATGLGVTRCQVQINKS